MVYVATDAIGATSTTYSMRGDQKKRTQKLFNVEVVKGLRDRGLRVVMYEASEGRESEALSLDRRRIIRALMDLLVCSRAKLFVHMLGTFSKDADKLEGCTGARAGSCYGNWVKMKKASFFTVVTLKACLLFRSLAFNLFLWPLGHYNRIHLLCSTHLIHEFVGSAHARPPPSPQRPSLCIRSRWWVI